MPEGAPQRFDADPAAYAAYLDTRLGRLRSELAWRNLSAHLGPPAPGRRALDLGAGTGELGLRLAAAGFSVTLVDGSPRMLARAAEAAGAAGLGGRVACLALDLDAPGLAERVGGGHDVVSCHHVLEYVASPEALLRAAAAALAPGGKLSLVVRSRTGEVLKRLLGGAEPEAALAILEAERVREDLYGLELRLFDAGEARALVRGAGLEVVAEHGVRIAADHLAEPREGDGGLERLVELERLLGERPELRGVARYLQVIAARPRAPR